MTSKSTRNTLPIHLVVGGCGFLGSYIVEQLLARGDVKVRVFDMRKGFEDSRVEFFLGSISNVDDLRPALMGVTTVYNTVSPPHGGTFESYYKINVEGTSNILKVAADCGVKKFVHTSSSSVVFSGKDLKGVDETQPFAKKHMDAYNHTKALAEVEVLNYNGKSGMLTVAIRPSAIFGPRDRQFLPTLIDAAREGKWKYKFGDSNLQDFTYVENVAHAHILASDKLKEGSGIEGQVFFITNDEPINPWYILGYMYKGLGFGEPYINLPVYLMIFFALMVDFFVWLLSPFVTLHPKFSYFRVATVAANRYFNIAKAKKLLGYKPLVKLDKGMEITLAYFVEQEKQRNEKRNK